MKRFGLFLSILACVLSVAGNLLAQTHPRLFFDASEVPNFRAKANTQPWADMLAAREVARTLDLSDSYSYIPRPANRATLHLFKGSGAAPADYAAQALNEVLWLIFAPDIRTASSPPVWAVDSFKSLTRAGRAIQVLQCYDLCFDAWAGQNMPESFSANGVTYTVPAPYAGLSVNAAISLALKNNADSLVRSGGAEWPGDTKTANNWFAVRYATAALSYLACDEAETAWSANFTTCVQKLVTHKTSNLTTSTQSRGWNPEGIAYAQYPGWHTYPFAYAYKRLKGVDLTLQIPGMKYELWSTYQGLLPIARYTRAAGPGETRPGYGLGLRPDFTDDHDMWDGEGTGALAFAFAPPAFIPGLKWQFRRTCGDLGDRTWDGSSGNGLYSLLFYPDATPEQNPASIPGWGLTYHDPVYGFYSFRNRFQDTDDVVFQTVAKLRDNNGGHEARDGMSFRLWGLNVPWAVGSGRTVDARGQTTLFPNDPETFVTGNEGLVPQTLDLFQRQNGDGYIVMNMDTSDTGVANHTRRYVLDYSGLSGAKAAVVVSDSSVDGAWWRLNTPSFNTVNLNGQTFTITSQEGHTLKGTVLWPPQVTLRTGNFTRGSGFAYKEVNYTPAANALGNYATQNKFVDFQGNGDGKFVVALTMQEAGVAAPEVTAQGTGATQQIAIGARQIGLVENAISVAGWTKPVVTVTTPQVNQQFNAGATVVTVSGTLSDADGLQRVDVALDNGTATTAELNTTTGVWSVTLPSVALGAHTLQVVGYDSVNDFQTVAVPFKVSSTVPPQVAITSPGWMTPLLGDQNVLFTGSAGDADGTVVTVEVFANGAKLGNATLNAAAGTWSYTWNRMPPGQHSVIAVATDNTADFTQTTSMTLTGKVPFANTNFGDASLYLMANSNTSGAGAPQLYGTKRWSIREHEGNLRLLGRENKNFDYANHINYLANTATLANWRLEYIYKIKADPGVPGYAPYTFVFFGRGISGSCAVDLRPNNGTKPEPSYFSTPNPRGTRLWYFSTNGTRPEFDWGTNPHLRMDAGYPNAPATDKAGLPGPGWHTVKIERIGRTLKTWVNGNVVIDANNAWCSTKGDIAFANERNDEVDLGDACWFDDVALTELDASGQPLQNAAPTATFTAPVAFQSQNVTAFTGTVTDADGLALAELYLGSEKVGSTTTSAFEIPVNLPAGQYSAAFRVTDSLGKAAWAEGTSFKVGATPNAVPTVTITGDATATGGIGLQGTYADADGLSTVVIVQVLRDGLAVGNATLTNGNWKFTATSVPSGDPQFVARVYDSSGAIAESVTYTQAWDGNTAPTITNISDKSTPQDTPTAGIAFTVGDAETSTAALTVSATSSNTTLVPNTNLVLTGSTGSRSLVATPAPGQSGLATITVTVSDGAKTASDAFVLTVTAPQVATSITLTPASATVAPGASQTFTASLRDQFGAAMASQPVWTWSVSSGGSISPSGVFTAGAALGGPHTVTVGSGGLTQTASISVSPAPVATSVTVTPATASVPAGGNQSFQASLSDQNGNAMPTQPSWTWTVSSGGGTISNTGVLSASSAAGSYTITASSGGLSGSASIVIGGDIPATAGNSTLVQWKGNYGTTSRTAPTTRTMNTVDLNGDGVLDAQRYLAISYTTPLSNGWAGYSGASAAIYGGFSLRILGSTSLPAIASDFFRNNGHSTIAEDDSFGFRYQPSVTASAVSATCFWQKVDFLNGGNSAERVEFNVGSKLRLSVADDGSNTSQRWENIGNARWMVREGTQWYASLTPLPSGAADKELMMTQAHSDGDWAPVDFTASGNETMNLGLAAASYAPQNFTNITSVGFYLENDAMLSTTRFWWYVDEFRVDAALVTSPPPSGYALYRTQAFPASVPATLREPVADADGDGLNNLLEYALGLNATATSTLPEPVVTVLENGQTHLEWKFPRPAGRTDVLIVPQTSENLLDWTTDPQEVSARIDSGTAGQETLSVRDERPLGSVNRRFFRLQALLQE